MFTPLLGVILLAPSSLRNVQNTVISRLGTILGQDICQALIGVHAFTGCDSVSAFGGQGKIKALNLINKSHEYRQLFIAFGQEWHVNEHKFQIVQAFTYEMYCAHTNTKLVNKRRYEMFCVKNGDISSGKLPPCSDALRQHTHCANYQAAIWRRSLENSPTVRSPTDGHGWNILDDLI